MLEYRTFYRRHLPHYQPPDARLFVTFRLVGSLPRSVIDQLQRDAAWVSKLLSTIVDPKERSDALYEEERRMFGRWDRRLDRAEYGPTWLSRPDIAALVAEAIQYRHNSAYDLLTCCIMPNHVHMVFRPARTEDGPVSLTKITHSLKRYTAYHANKILGRQGQFWQHESYDHVIRGADEQERICYYVRNNPVKASLVGRAEEWPWTFP